MDINQYNVIITNYSMAPVADVKVLKDITSVTVAGLGEHARGRLKIM